MFRFLYFNNFIILQIILYYFLYFIIFLFFYNSIFLFFFYNFFMLIYNDVSNMSLNICFVLINIGFEKYLAMKILNFVVKIAENRISK